MAPSEGAQTVDLVEIFSSVQGEGLHVGRSTLFVRFARCDLRCAWCDSPQTWRPSRQCRIERLAGRGNFERLESPVALDRVIAALERLGIGRHRFVSLTGGEPLLQPDAVLALARAVRGAGGRVFLETHGLAVEAIEAVAPEIDVVSMDWKLASDVRRESDPAHGAVAPFHDRHERFLKASLVAGEVTVKVVVTPSTGADELAEVCRRLEAVAPEIPLVLQPVTPFGRVKEAPSPERLLELMRDCEAVLPDVRLVPQTHKAYGAL